MELCGFQYVHIVRTVVYFVGKLLKEVLVLKKLKGSFIGLILAIITVLIFVPIQVQKINQYYKVNDNSVRYNTSYNKHKS